MNITNKINKYIDSIDIIYWINLDRSIQRRKNMEQNLKHFNIKQKRIQATDAKLDENIYSYFINHGEFNRTKIEYAVLHSHLKTIEEFSNSPYELALIFEDDISLEYVHLWDKKISDIIKNAPKDWDIIMLNYVCEKKLYELYTLNKNGKISSCLSYIINKNAAKKLINMNKKNNKYILHNNRIHTADDYIYSLLNTYSYKYPYFTYPNNNDSTIDISHISWGDKTKKIAYENWKEKQLNKYRNKINIIIQFYIFIFILIIILFVLKYKKTIFNI